MARYASNPIAPPSDGSKFTGAALATQFNELAEAVTSGHYHEIRPEGAAKGCLWCKKVGDDIQVMLFDGGADLMIAQWSLANGLQLVASVDASNLGSGTVPLARLPHGTTADKIVKLDGSAKLPAVDGSQLTNGSVRAWVNFNGTGVAAIRSSFNVSSITHHGTGDYTINFTTPMPTADFALLGTASDDASLYPRMFGSWTRATSNVRVLCRDINGALNDMGVVSLAIIL